MVGSGEFELCSPYSSHTHRQGAHNDRKKGHLHVMYQRRAMRRMTPDPVPEDLLVK